MGDGLVLLKGGGATVVQDLQPGESLRVASGSIIAFERSVQYDPFVSSVTVAVAVIVAVSVTVCR